MKMTIIIKRDMLGKIVKIIQLPSTTPLTCCKNLIMTKPGALLHKHIMVPVGHIQVVIARKKLHHLDIASEETSIIMKMIMIMITSTVTIIVMILTVIQILVMMKQDIGKHHPEAEGTKSYPHLLYQVNLWIAERPYQLRWTHWTRQSGNWGQIQTWTVKKPP